MFLFVVCFSQNAENLMDELSAKYRDHRITDYQKARWNLYSDVDCYDNQIFRLYSSPLNFECHKSKEIPPDKDANAEHIVPQSYFSQELPYRSDLHHLFASGKLENGARSNYPFAEVPYENCVRWYYDGKTYTQQPENPENFDCLSNEPTKFMPLARDRGTVARAVLYFLTMYPEVNADTLRENYTVLLKWNREYPPTKRELYRNDMVNITQGNRNPFIDNPQLADLIYGEEAQTQLLMTMK